MDEKEIFLIKTGANATPKFEVMRGTGVEVEL